MHAYATDSTGPTVTRRFILLCFTTYRRRRTRKYPSAPQPALAVNAPAYGVPNMRSKLPLINNMRTLSQRHQRRVSLCKRHVIVNIAHARAVTQSGPRFPTPFCPRDFNSTKNAKIPLNLSVNNAR